VFPLLDETSWYILEVELLKLQKSGQFPDELEYIRKPQSNSLRISQIFVEVNNPFIMS
jgi:hypothetical protein